MVFFLGLSALSFVAVFRFLFFSLFLVLIFGCSGLSLRVSSYCLRLFGARFVCFGRFGWRFFSLASCSLVPGFSLAGFSGVSFFRVVLVLLSLHLFVW